MSKRKEIEEIMNELPKKYIQEWDKIQELYKEDDGTYIDLTPILEFILKIIRFYKK